MQENINLGAVQAPYWEQVLTLQPGETRKVDYVYDSFNLLQASIPEVLEVTFGGAATQTKFSAGMGYHYRRRSAIFSCLTRQTVR